MRKRDSRKRRTDGSNIERRCHPGRLESGQGTGASRVAPVLVLSNDVFNEMSGTVIALAITGQPQKAGFPLTHELSGFGLPKRSWVKISQIRTLSAERLGRKIGRVDPEELDTIIEGLNEILSE